MSIETRKPRKITTRKQYGFDKMALNEAIYECKPENFRKIHEAAYKFNCRNKKGKQLRCTPVEVRKEGSRQWIEARKVERIK